MAIAVNNDGRRTALYTGHGSVLAMALHVLKDCS